jgi:hypothetical protein
VTIDAALHGLPIVCFDGATGLAPLLSNDAKLSCCVVPHLDVQAAACVIANLANDENARAEIGEAARRFGQATFDMDRYVDRLDALGQRAIKVMRQRALDFLTVRNDPLFDETMFLPLTACAESRDEAILEFLTRWAAVGKSHRPTMNPRFRRPCPGFHPQIYAHENADTYEGALVNPLAHFIRNGRPEGPWRHDVIIPPEDGPISANKLRVALHVHFFYPELCGDFLRKLSRNHSRCDLLISTTDTEKAKALNGLLTRYDGGGLTIRIVPNRGRDIGPFLTGFAKEIKDHYDIIGHLHTKRSLLTGDLDLGETWREFLWQNLIGDLYPMIDNILNRFHADEQLGIVFPDDPHLPDWDGNLRIATDLANRIGIKRQLPPFFDFPVGMMFWARTKALRPLFQLNLDWNDYPEEPLPYDGTSLHAIERLLPFVTDHAGYRFATTHIPGLTW